MITLFKTSHMMYKKTPEQKRSEFASLETARETGKAEGLAEGLAEGKAKERAIIKRLLASNTLSVSEISKVLDMDPETVEEINASL